MSHINTNLGTEILGHPRMADLLIETISKAGATHVFAMPAESLNPIIDAIRRQKQVKLVTVRHEGHGAIMASAYAKLTGRLGVCMGTAGPGETHLPIGTYDAKADSVPLLAISGQVPTSQLGSGGFQEIDSLTLFQDSSGFNRLVTSVEQTGLLSLACTHALYHNSPVHLAFPGNILAKKIEPPKIAQLEPQTLQSVAVTDPDLLQYAGSLLSGKKNNILILVGDVEETVQKAVEKIASKLIAPILVLPEGIHYFRSSPEYPTVRLTHYIKESLKELLPTVNRILVVGRMSSSVSQMIPLSAQVVQIASENEVTQPIYGSTCRLLGNIEELLLKLCQELGEVGDGNLFQQVERILKTESTKQPLREFWEAFDQVIPQDAVITLEPGLVLESAFEHLPLRQRTITSSFNHGTRSYAFPAAVAATIACPQQKVVAVTTSEGLAETMAELLTVQKYFLPVNIVCLENNERHVTIDYAAFARAAEIESKHVADWSTFIQVGKICLNTSDPCLISVSSELVSPLPLPSEESHHSQIDVSSDFNFGHLLIGVLASAGVSKVFGSDKQALSHFRKILSDDGRIEFFSVIDAESAAMMASAHSKWTGQLSVCVVANSPDLLLQLNGLYDAAFDSNPVIIISSSSDLSESQTAPSIVNTTQLLADVATSSYRLCPNEQAVALLNQAVGEAIRLKTVVHISLDWTQLAIPMPSLPIKFNNCLKAERLIPSESQIQKALDKLAQATRPAILVGRGATGARQEIEKLATLLQTPIITTMPGRGIIPDTYPQMVGGIGGSGHRAAITTLETCDVLLILGCSNRGTLFGFSGNCFIIQIDRNPLQLGRRPCDTLSLYGNIKETLQIFNQHLSVQFATTINNSQSFLQQQRQRFERWHKSADRLRHCHHSPIRPPAIAHTLRKVLTDLAQKAILTVDVGVTTLWIYRHFVADHDIIWTSSFATMGFALPSAIAIASLEPSRPVIAIAGDGGIGITMAELATAVRQQIPIVVIIFNNSKLAAIKYEQEVMGWPEYESYLYNCNFADYAEACGAKGIRVTEPLQLEASFREAITCRQPCLVDVVCNPHEMPPPPKIKPLQGVGYFLALAREFRLSLAERLQSSQSSKKVPTRYNDPHILDDH